jgi:hypothetical protein
MNSVAEEMSLFPARFGGRRFIVLDWFTRHA